MNWKEPFNLSLQKGESVLNQISKLGTTLTLKESEYAQVPVAVGAGEGHVEGGKESNPHNGGSALTQQRPSVSQLIANLCGSLASNGVC